MARNDVRQAAAFARRLVCRALTVVGGVAAGTALAWVLSSATASAETPADVPVAVQELAEPVAAPVAEPVEQTADTLARQLQDPPPPPPQAITDLGQKVKDAVRGDRLPELPSCGTACFGDERHDYLGDVFGRSDLPTAPAPVPAATAVTPGAAVDALVPGTAKDRAFADGMSRRGSPVPALPALPALPNWPAPWSPWSPAPVGIPTTGNFGSAGNSADSHLFAALPWQARGVDLVAGGIAAATDAATVGRVGAQPGVAPD